MMTTATTQTHIVEAALAATTSSFRFGSLEPWTNRDRALAGRSAR
jgi:hypothetical protein